MLTPSRLRTASKSASFSRLAAHWPVQSRRVVRKCKPGDDKEGKPDVKKAISDLRKADVDQASAREIIKMWRESGVTDDPEELRKLYKKRGNSAIGRFAIQLFLDACACYAVRCLGAFQAANAIDAGQPFFGKFVLVFIFWAVTFNYALAFLSNSLSLVISLRSMNRFGTNAAAYLEAIKEIAGPTSLDSLTKVQSVIDSLKIAKSLEKMDDFLKARAAQEGGKMGTVESLAVYFILSEARDKLGFKAEEYGLSEDGPAIEQIARIFAKYDTNGDGRIDRSELRSLCSDAGRDLTDEETSAALTAIDENGNGYIEFNEFVAFWVDPTSKVADFKKSQEPDKKNQESGTLAKS